MAHHRELEAAAERQAVDGGDDRLGEILEVLEQIAGSRPRRLAEFGDVGATRESPFGPGEHDSLDCGVVLDLAQGRKHAFAQVEAKRVDGCVLHLDEGDVAVLAKVDNRVDIAHWCTPWLRDV